MDEARFDARLVGPCDANPRDDKIAVPQKEMVWCALHRQGSFGKSLVRTIDIFRVILLKERHRALCI